MKNKKKNYELPTLKQMTLADRKKLNEWFHEISARQSKCGFGSEKWTEYNICLNVIRIELEQRALGK
ncbi:hypothetical protein ES703_14461 [subsurface metagenome]